MNIHYLNIAGTDYPICFSGAAIEDIVAAFGGMEAMSEGLLGQDITVVGKVITILINAGSEYCRMMDLEYPPTPKGRIMALVGIKEMKDMVEQIFTAMTEDSERSVEVRSKNA